MKYFKHHGIFRDDQNVAEYLDAFGRGAIEGYGFLMMVLETIVKQMGKDSPRCEVHYSRKAWSRLLNCHPNRITKYMGLFAETGVVVVKKTDNGYRVAAPMLAKLLDEYFRKVGVTPDKV